MPLTIRLLSAGATLAGGTTSLYTVNQPASGAIVNNVRLANPLATGVLVNLFFKPSGGSQVRILEKDKTVSAGEILVVRTEMTMARSDELQVIASGVMDFVVSGSEQVDES